MQESKHFCRQCSCIYFPYIPSVDQAPGFKLLLAKPALISRAFPRDFCCTYIENVGWADPIQSQGFCPNYIREFGLWRTKHRSVTSYLYFPFHVAAGLCRTLYNTEA